MLPKPSASCRKFSSLFSTSRGRRLETAFKDSITKQAVESVPNKTMLYADITRLLYRHLTKVSLTGIDRVNLEYARWVMKRGGKLCAKRGRRLLELASTPWLNHLLEGRRQAGTPANRIAQRGNTLMKWWLARRPVGVGETVLVPTHVWLGQDATWRWVTSRRLRAVVFIHDLIPIDFPEYQRPREKISHEIRMRLTLRHSAAIVANSHCTKSAICRFAEEERLQVPPLLVAPLGHNLPVAITTTLTQGLRAPYFVVLGTIEPRKNHLLLLALWRHLTKELGTQTPQLVVVGRRGWECEQVVDMLERCEAIHPHLLEVNNASDQLVATLIKGARALLMPSYAEGFGMPVQEALALGTPVISSPLPAIQEFAGDIPDYAEPHDGMRWEELVRSYAADPSPQRQAQMERLKSFKDTTWPQHFALVEEFLEKAS
jgi:glycosyltransferase involved in cell wall biosynthesis